MWLCDCWPLNRWRNDNNVERRAKLNKLHFLHDAMVYLVVRVSMWTWKQCSVVIQYVIWWFTNIELMTRKKACNRIKMDSDIVWEKSLKKKRVEKNSNGRKERWNKPKQKRKAIEMRDGGRDIVTDRPTYKNYVNFNQCSIYLWLFFCACEYMPLCFALSSFFKLISLM